MRIAMGLLCVLLCVPLLRAGEEKDVEARLRELQDIVGEAQARLKAGRVEEANELLRQAEEIQRELHQVREERDDRVNLVNAVEHLQAAEKFLRQAGRKDAAGAVERLAAELRGSLEPRERGDREADMVRHHLEILRIAMHGLLEAEKRDAADRVEHAIHARELSLQGRRDEEANHIRESAPPPGELAELLLVSAALWREFGQPGKAEQVEELARWLQERPRQGPGRERREGGGELAERVAGLERRMEHLEVTLKELIAQLKRK